MNIPVNLGFEKYGVKIGGKYNFKYSKKTVVIVGLPTEVRGDNYVDIIVEDKKGNFKNDKPSETYGGFYYSEELDNPGFSFVSLNLLEKEEITKYKIRRKVKIFKKFRIK